jgi:hypothetical protein
MLYTYPLRGWKYPEGTGEHAPLDRTRRTGRNRPQNRAFLLIDSFSGRNRLRAPVPAVRLPTRRLDTGSPAPTRATMTPVHDAHGDVNTDPAKPAAAKPARMLANPCTRERRDRLTYLVMAWW